MWKSVQGTWGEIELFIDYGKYSDEYDMNYTSEMSKRENMAVKLILDSYIYKPYSVLDVGCGTCFTMDICDFINKDRYLGIEVSKDMCELAREKYPECNIINEDINNLKAIEGHFDVAVSTFSIPYIGVGAIDKIYDSLKDGGYFIAVYYDKPYRNTDSVYHNRRLKYELTVRPLVHRFIKKAKKKFDRVVMEGPLTYDHTYKAIIFKKAEKKGV